MRSAIFSIVAGLMLSLGASAQRASDDSQPASLPDAPVAPAVTDKLSHSNERDFLKHLAQDQLTIWTSPAHVTRNDLQWLMPSSGIAAGLFVTDPDSAWGMASYHAQGWKEASNYTLGAAFATTAGMYAWGAHRQRRALARDGRARNRGDARRAADAVCDSRRDRATATVSIELSKRIFRWRQFVPFESLGTGVGIRFGGGA